MEFSKQQIKTIIKIVFSAILFYFILKEFRLVISGLGYLWSVFGVFAIGGAMAFIINVPMTFIEKHYLSRFKHIDKAKRPMAFVLTLIIVITVVYLVMFIVVPELIATLQLLVVQMQDVYDRLPQIVADMSAKLNLTEETVKSLQIEWSHICGRDSKFLNQSYRQCGKCHHTVYPCIYLLHLYSFFKRKAWQSLQKDYLRSI